MVHQTGIFGFRFFFVFFFYAGSMRELTAFLFNAFLISIRVLSCYDG